MTKTTKNKILFIEDDLDQVEILKDKFELEGFEVFFATSGKEGVKLAGAKKPDLIFLDIVMKDMDGIDTLRKIKANPRAKKIPVIMLTNLAKRKLAARCRDLGALDYIIKTEVDPVDLVIMSKDIFNVA